MEVSTKSSVYLMVVALSALPFSMSTMAHDPSEHMAGAEKPDCSTMDTAGDMKMDMSDPVARAVMKQCMDDMTTGENHAGFAEGQHTEDTEGDKREHTQGQAGA